ncbi:MAG: hypothetical protein ACETWC_10950 [Acidobacteriota bacterium]
MNKSIPKSYLSIIVMLGAVWGFSEAGLGMGLRSCASFVSGSIMTGVALFFIAASWVVTRNILGIALLIVIASLFKMFDALLLSLPIQHGAVANPIFAFLMQGAAFLILISLFNKKLKQKVKGQALMGGMAALVAVNLFPLVRYVTGIPACVVPGTGYPLSLYYAHVAVFLSAVTVPVGLKVGAKIRVWETKWEGAKQRTKLSYLASPATLIICLAIIALIRLS